MKSKTILSALIGLALGLGLSFGIGAYAHQGGYGMGTGHGMMGAPAPTTMMGQGHGYTTAWNTHGAMHATPAQAGGHGHPATTAMRPLQGQAGICHTAAAADKTPAKKAKK